MIPTSKHSFISPEVHAYHYLLVDQEPTTNHFEKAGSVIYVEKERTDESPAKCVSEGV